MKLAQVIISLGILIFLSAFKTPENKEETLETINVEVDDLGNFNLATPSGTVNAFRSALKAGDAGTVLELLDENVLIFESGYVERSKEEYAGHHMPADMKFSAAMTQAVLSQKEMISGDMATVVTETHTTGTYNNRDYNLMGTGTMILKRDGQGWKIIHIHWSSRDNNN